MKTRILFLAGLILTMALSGCVTTKVVETERVDQEVCGNQGYITGNPPSLGSPSGPTTRQFIQIDVEMPPYRTQKEIMDKETWGNQGYVNRPAMPQAQKPTVIFPPRPAAVEEEDEYLPASKSAAKKTKPAIAVYTVKKNDSLWKIARRPDVYADGNKWAKIYQANKDKIKNPNKLRPGIVLTIPQD